MKKLKVTLEARIAAATSLASIMLLAGCQEAKPTVAAAAPQVDVVEIQPTKLRVWDEFNGRVSAIESVEIRPRVTGYITKVAYTEGAGVKKGDLLFVVDPRPYRAALDNARAQMERAKAALLLARQQDARAQTLFANKAASREEVEEKRAALETNLSALRAAESAITIATLDLEFTEVRSPIDGRTSRARMTVGNLALADQSILTSVVSQNPIHVYFDPDEHSFLRYREALRADRSSPANLTARVGLASDKGFPYEGKVSFIDNQLNPATGTIQARAVVDNADLALTSGLFARVQFAAGGEISAMLIDDRAILTDQNHKYVYVLGEQDKVVRRDVEPGKMIRGKRLIEAGLQPGEKVVVAGLQRIYAPGTTVAPTLIHPEHANDATPSAAALAAASR